MVIQLVYMGESGYLAIKGIKPDKDNVMVGEITIVVSPTYIERQERYHIEKELLVTDNFLIPMAYISNFLVNNDCVQTGEDGKDYVILKEVEFNLEQ